MRSSFGVAAEGSAYLKDRRNKKGRAEAPCLSYVASVIYCTDT
jgi:hypothetical protein